MSLRIKSDKDKRPLSYHAPANSNIEKLKLSRGRSMYGDNRNKQIGSRTRTESFGVLEELVQCGICLERLSHPKMLPCQHTFCLTCLQSHLLANQLKNAPVPTLSDIKNSLNRVALELECITCSKKTTLLNGLDGLENLPTNLYIDSLLKLLNSETTDSKKTHTGASEGIKCAKCLTSCQLNERNCAHCKLVFCMECWPKHVQELQKKMQEFAKQLADSEDQLNYKQEDYERHCVQLKECVKVCAEKKMLEIREMENDIMKEIEALRGSTRESYNEIKGTIHTLAKDIKISSTSNKADDDQVKNYMQHHSKISKLIGKVSHFGETNEIFNADTFKLEQEYEPNNQDDDVLQDILIGNALDSEKNLMTHYKTRHFATKLMWSKCPKLAGVGLPPWSPNVVYVAATDSRVVLMLKRSKNKLIGRLSHPDMLCPYSLDFCKVRKETFISDKWKHCVHVFSENGDYLRALCTRGHDQGQVISPQGLALTDNGELLVCDTGNDRVLILDPVTGEQKSTIGLNGRRTELNMPTDVAVYKDKIFIADTGNHRIKIYNQNGEKINEIGSLGQERGQFRCAEVVTVDPLGFILVGDSGNGRIQVFDPSGNFVRCFGCSNSKSSLKWVSGLCVTPELDIIATDHKNQSLIIF